MKKIFLMVAIAAFFMLPIFSTAAYATTDRIADNSMIIEELPEPDDILSVPASEYPTEQPFTPSGTGTVIDTATDADGKVFYTIMTPDEHIFYLVIDKQRGQENVYFLNAVTIADLMTLAEIPELPQAGIVTTPLPNIEPETTNTTMPELEPEQGSGNMGTLIFIAVIVIIGGGAGWYFKIYRPKQQQTGNEEEYIAAEPYPYDEDEQDAWPDDDDVPWYEDEEDGGE